MASVAKRRTAVSDALSGGGATISGIVKILTAPASRPVVLFDQETMQPRRSTRSAASGAYSFAGVAEGRQWIVMSFDTDSLYNATVADRVQT